MRASGTFAAPFCRGAMRVFTRPGLPVGPSQFGARDSPASLPARCSRLPGSRASSELGDPRPGMVWTLRRSCREPAATTSRCWSRRPGSAGSTPTQSGLRSATSSALRRRRKPCGEASRARPKRRSDYGAAQGRAAGDGFYVGQHRALSEAPRERTSSGVGALGPVLQVSVRGRLVAPARLFRFLGRGITGARRLVAFALFSIVASAELCCVLVSQGVLSSGVSP